MYYTMITLTELTQDYERLKRPYDPKQIIETLFRQIQRGHAFAVAGGQPYSDAMIINFAFTLEFTTGVFPGSCCAW
jgi:hypothetical protein